VTRSDVSRTPRDRSAFSDARDAIDRKERRETRTDVRRFSGAPVARARGDALDRAATRRARRLGDGAATRTRARTTRATRDARANAHRAVERDERDRSRGRKTSD